MPKHGFGRKLLALHFYESCIKVTKDLKDKRHHAVHNRNRKNIRVGVKKQPWAYQEKLFLIMVQNLDWADINRGKKYIQGVPNTITI